jgi:hypothetical protein
MFESQDQSEKRVERAAFETDRLVVVGDVTLPPQGYQSRFSDSLNRDGLEFLPLTDLRDHLARRRPHRAARVHDALQAPHPRRLSGGLTAAAVGHREFTVLLDLGRNVSPVEREEDG